ncbi:MAG: SMP-30/gluconolactonase/LRE family protein [Pseudomonadota bacterium]
MQHLISDLVFPECPRWHQNALWFSDMHDEKVYRVNLQGEIEETIAVPGQPGGLGWLPGGDLLVVSMKQNKLVRYHNGGLQTYADLGGLHAHDSNDMVVDQLGRAYIGNFGFAIHEGETPTGTHLARIGSNGVAHTESEGLMCPNGMALIDDGKTLVVAETFAARLTAYSIAEDGSLYDKRTWATLGKYAPDGICADSEGNIWVAACIHHLCIKVRQGGEILARIDMGKQNPFACELGGEDGKRLFICSALSSDPETTHISRSGRIDYLDVDVGRPD